MENVISFQYMFFCVTRGKPTEIQDIQYILCKELKYIWKYYTERNKHT